MNEELEQRVRARTSELQRSNDALQQFAYSASHDLQEPLRMVSSYAGLLERRYKHLLDEDGKEYLFFLVDGAVRMTGLIRDLLAFSRAGNVSPDPPEDVNLEEVLESALVNLQTAVEESGALISSTGLPTVRCKRFGLVQVFQNLLSNSIKYRSDATPIIEVRSEARADEWLISIRDNGLGFEQEHAERAFGVFQRLHRRDYPGTGMGLAICRRILEGKGGRIWAESSPGAGATFSFTLPKATVKGKPTESVRGGS